MRDDGQGGDAARPDSALERSQTVGRFRFFIDDDRWEWSDDVQEIHGYARGEMPNPTTAQVLSHKHPDDYAYVVSVLEDTRRTGAAFSTRHRMLDKQGREHRVAVVGDLIRDADGIVVGTEGFYIDVSSTEDYEGRLSEAVAEFAEHRAVIEQAKGMLGVVYGLDEDAAFEILKWRSQQSNVKLRIIAERLVSAFRTLSAPVLPERSAYDHILLTLTGP